MRPDTDRSPLCRALGAAGPAFSERKQAKTNGIVAIRALAHKLARASYYMLKEQKPFEPNRLFG